MSSMGDGEKEEWGVTIIGFRVPFLGWWNVLKLTVVMVAQFREYTKNHWIVPLKNEFNAMWILSQ